MAVDLRILGKLLALSRSHEPAEAMLAATRFHNLLNRWCTENGLPVGSGYVTLAEPDNAACKLAEALANHCDVRVLALEPFELIAIGPERDCRWIFWWFHRVYPQIEKTARRSNFRERHVFMHGAILGIDQELNRRAHSPQAEKKTVERAAPRQNADEPESPDGSAGNPTPAEPAPPPPLSQPQRSVLNDGLTYGIRLAAVLLPLKPRPGAKS